MLEYFLDIYGIKVGRIYFYGWKYFILNNYVLDLLKEICKF